MSKIAIDLVKSVLMRNELDVRTVAKIVDDLNLELSNEETERTPREKKQFCILVSDPDGTLKGKDIVGWVAQIPEEESPYTVEEKITKAAYEFNQSPKGRRMPVTRIGEACEVVSPKFMKPQGITIKTKEPILITTTNNKIDWDAEAARMNQD